MTISPEELAMAARRAAELTDSSELLLVGSQAIVAMYKPAQIPGEATMSAELDVVARSREDHFRITEELGEMSEFHQEHGFYVQAVRNDLISRVQGWEERAARIEVASGDRDVAVWCMDVNDLCLSMLAAERTKDVLYVNAMLQDGLADRAVIEERAELMLSPDDIPAVKRTLQRIDELPADR
ncbi:DUF6036 family nucleotidyltransferase [Leifsonia sp. Leaf264]|uniref:DUF6036 family nucleotidyltransferase n=1 Tax=Leifsonia sp. Leaf264 TaxID=1736314 RepID=UPI000700D9D1|nr:DUF6036 family nucleotidyltransferase [Leifsonia sp. Leaf264]KQO98698.1 hypothetical protein ASF30_11590 [Leifsonia sp. Leaf264]